MKLIERDIILVNNLTEASNLMEMTESFIRYIMLKESASPKKTEQQQEGEKKTKKTVKDVSKRSKKSTKEEDSQKKRKRLSQLLK